MFLLKKNLQHKTFLNQLLLAIRLCYCLWFLDLNFAYRFPPDLQNFAFKDRLQLIWKSNLLRRYCISKFIMLLYEVSIYLLQYNSMIDRIKVQDNNDMISLVFGNHSSNNNRFIYIYIVYKKIACTVVVNIQL